MSEWERSDEGMFRRGDDEPAGEIPEPPEPEETLAPQFDADEAPVAEAASNIVQASTSPNPAVRAAAVQTITATTAAAKQGDPRAAAALRAMVKVKTFQTMVGAKKVVLAAQSPNPATRAAAHKVIAASASAAKSNRPGSYLPALAIAKTVKVQKQASVTKAARGIMSSFFSRSPAIVAAARKTVTSTAAQARAGKPAAKFAFSALLKAVPKNAYAGKKPLARFVPPRASFNFSAGFRR